jgi:quercetin dioxygenase-like cupin family protein
VGVRIRSETGPGWSHHAPGVRVRPLIEGAGTSLQLYRLQPGARCQPHSHGFPELGLLLSGEGIFTVGVGERAVQAGDSYYFPAGLSHGFWVPEGGEEVVMVDVSAALGTTVTPELADALLRVARAHPAVIAPADPHRPIDDRAGRR